MWHLFTTQTWSFALNLLDLKLRNQKNWISGKNTFFTKENFFQRFSAVCLHLFSNGGNALLGAGYSVDGQGLFFSVTHGMITIQPSHQPAKDKSK